MKDKTKTETVGRNEKNTDKQFYTKFVDGKMKGCLSLFFPPNCYFGRRKEVVKLPVQVSQKLVKTMRISCVEQSKLHKIN